MSAGVLRIVDETSTGKPLREVTLELRLVRERITARELIARRVRAEAAEATRAETASADATTAAAPAAIATATAAAFTAFERNGFLLLVGDEQVEDLDDEIVIGEDVKVTFVRLVPLVGG